MKDFLSPDNKAFFYCLVVLSVILSRIPFIGKLLRTVNTLVHESGHALIALFTGGGVVEINLQYDTSGAAKTQSKYWLGKVLVSLAGYPSSCLAAFGAFWLIKNTHYNWVLYVFIALALLNLALWVRNWYGFVWLLIMLAASGFALYYKNDVCIYAIGVAISTIILIESFISTVILVIISVKEPAKSGDANNLYAFTYIPQIIWALLFMAIACYLGYAVLNLFY